MLKNGVYESGAEVFSRLNRELAATEYSESVNKRMKRRAYVKMYQCPIGRLSHFYTVKRWLKESEKRRKQKWNSIRR